MKFFLVRIFQYSDQKKLLIWTLFTQCLYKHFKPVSTSSKDIQENIVYCYQNRNLPQTFLGGQSHLETFQEIFQGEITFQLKYRTQRPRTLPNFIIDLFMRVFWNTCCKTLENIQAPFCINFTKNTFLEVGIKKGMLKDNPLQSHPFFSNVNGLQSRISTWTKTGSTKNFSWAFWNSSETCLEEVYNEIILWK